MLKATAPFKDFLEGFKMKAVATVIGQDQVGIIAKVSAYFADNGINILDISQTIMQNMFCMIMLVEFSKDGKKMDTITKELTMLGEEMGLSIHMQREELFGSMHRI